jgi:hypothetical protein
MTNGEIGRGQKAEMVRKGVTFPTIFHLSPHYQPCQLFQPYQPSSLLLIIFFFHVNKSTCQPVNLLTRQLINPTLAPS